MNRTRHQEGYIYARSGSWYLRYRVEMRQSDGSTKQVHRAHRLAPVCRRYSTRKSVRVLADEYLLEHNSGRYDVDSTMTMQAFVEERYFPHYAQQNWRPSVLSKELWRWRKHTAPVCGDVQLRDFRPQDGQGPGNQAGPEAVPHRHRLRYRERRGSHRQWREHRRPPRARPAARPRHHVVNHQLLELNVPCAFHHASC